MKYIISWTVPQSTFNVAVARFLETGGAPPKGVTMLGRWHGMDSRGFAISESTDAKAMYQWVAQWSDVLSLTVTPCVVDADAGRQETSKGFSESLMLTSDWIVERSQGDGTRACEQDSSRHWWE